MPFYNVEIGEAMQERLRLLVKLQEIDREIIGIKKTLSRLPEEARKRSGALEKKKEKLARLEQNYNALSVDSRELDLEMKALEAQINRSQEKLLEVKTQREYNAMRTQIASLKADLRRNEDSALQLMERLEAMEKEISALRAEVEQEESLIRELEEKAADEREAARGHVAELRKKREELVAAIDPEDYNLYRKHMRPPVYMALSPVVEEAGSSALCSACNAVVEPQTLNRLYIGHEFVFCSNCGRLLYLPGKLAGAEK